MQDGSHLWISPKAVVCGFAKPILHVVGSLPGHANGRGRGGLCAVEPAPAARAGPVGAGLAFAEGGREALSAGDDDAAGDPGRPEPARGCAPGDGGGVALHRSGRCGRGDLGRSAGSGFHGDQAVGLAGGTSPGALLADPARGLSRSERCAQSLARDLPAIVAPSRRCQGTGRAALAGRTFPGASSAARHMDCHL